MLILDSKFAWYRIILILGEAEGDGAEGGKPKAAHLPIWASMRSRMCITIHITITICMSTITMSISITINIVTITITITVNLTITITITITAIAIDTSIWASMRSRMWRMGQRAPSPVQAQVCVYK